MAAKLRNDCLDSLSELVDSLLVVEREPSIFVRVGAPVVIRALDYLEITGIFDVMLFAKL